MKFIMYVLATIFCLRQFSVLDPDPFHFGLLDPEQFHETDMDTDLGSKKSTKIMENLNKN